MSIYLTRLYQSKQTISTKLFLLTLIFLTLNLFFYILSLTCDSTRKQVFSHHFLFFFFFFFFPVMGLSLDGMCDKLFEHRLVFWSGGVGTSLPSIGGKSCGFYKLRKSWKDLNARQPICQHYIQEVKITNFFYNQTTRDVYIGWGWSMCVLHRSVVSTGLLFLFYCKNFW